MNILICNERFLFRFGLDRLLLILGKGLGEAGHTVTFMGNHFDEEIVATIGSRLIKVPMETDEYLNLNEYTADWLQRLWKKLFETVQSPTVVLVGGWPFLASIPFFKRVCQHVVFIDCGAVSTQGYTGYALKIQNKVREFRTAYIPATSLIIAISDFISHSQSAIDSQGVVPVKTILLGADHMEMSLWCSHLLKTHGDWSAFQTFSRLKQEEKKIILSLGRWEPQSYKNSDAAYDFIQHVNAAVSECKLLILADPADMKLNGKERDMIIPIGFPDDAELTEIMRGCDLGISFSTWEGFNLPIAEMQWLGRPVLAFDLAAHPEVILHPWYLCKNSKDMVSKAISILTGSDLDIDIRNQALAKFRKYFTWDRVINDYVKTLTSLVAERELMPVHDERMTLIVDVTNATRDPANSGVMRVTRRLGRELQNHADVVFVIWDAMARHYVLPTKQEFMILSQFNGPAFFDEKQVSSDNASKDLDSFLAHKETGSAWLLFTETVNETHGSTIRKYARQRGINLAAIFYDAIPVLKPEFCKDLQIRDNHEHYMRGLAECDMIIPISKYSADCLEEFWASQNIDGCAIRYALLPGEFSGIARNQRIFDQQPKVNRILCVSTLEPRKNHATLIQALLLLLDEHQDLQWELTLVGNRYAGAEDIAEQVEAVAKRHPRIKWPGIVSDSTLERLYQEASFTIYPSVIEGFGMPIMESMWHGKPCICSQQGVMAELAAEGGCLTTNILDARSMAESIYRLSTDTLLYQSLAKEAASRTIKTWKDYGQEILMTLLSFEHTTRYLSLEEHASAMKTPKWEDIFYPECLCDNWQMNHSERLALTALMARHKPQCCIEIGTFQGGSLSLIAQYSQAVFSIDIDPEIPGKFGFFNNVSFLTGPSSVILPILLKELDSVHMPVDFILIDGDHSAEGVRQDIDRVLSYVPKKPLFVMMHDSFNPECRRGMLEAHWDSSPYVNWVDIDFIPGRVVEHGGGDGEMWGGLGLAYLTPQKRKTTLSVTTSAGTMYAKLKDLQYK